MDFCAVGAEVAADFWGVPGFFFCDVGDDDAAFAVLLEGWAFLAATFFAGTFFATALVTLLDGAVGGADLAAVAVFLADAALLVARASPACAGPFQYVLCIPSADGCESQSLKEQRDLVGCVGREKSTTLIAMVIAHIASARGYGQQQPAARLEQTPDGQCGIQQVCVLQMHQDGGAHDAVEATPEGWARLR